MQSLSHFFFSTHQSLKPSTDFSIEVHVRLINISVNSSIDILSILQQYKLSELNNESVRNVFFLAGGKLE